MKKKEILEHVLKIEGLILKIRAQIFEIAREHDKNPLSLFSLTDEVAFLEDYFDEALFHIAEIIDELLQP